MTKKELALRLGLNKEWRQLLCELQFSASAIKQLAPAIRVAQNHGYTAASLRQRILQEVPSNDEESPDDLEKMSDLYDELCGHLHDDDL